MSRKTSLGFQEIFKLLKRFLHTLTAVVCCNKPTHLHCCQEAKDNKARADRARADKARAVEQSAHVQGRGPARGQGSARLQVQGLAGLTGIHCARLHVPGADLGATSPTCAVIVHIPAHGNTLV